MQKQNQTKLFAFKLAEKKEQEKPVQPAPWKVRDGVAVAGCTAVDSEEQYRYSRVGSSDGGDFC
ncbi:hypothetical protein D3C81_435930 [compost metagenome]|uniref:hypothetical protein n=1 Tax=Janthinobacterium sp. AD80 TaxID=1528773 RepID=UPI000C828C1A|nr:hypothetical protein [Janthinobacterium sp. AD80]PMQ11057.1 hypothetical protein JaAD80_24050 [Janthinobacterium sp. AD80]